MTELKLLAIEDILEELAHEVCFEDGFDEEMINAYASKIRNMTELKGGKMAELPKVIDVPVVVKDANGNKKTLTLEIRNKPALWMD